MSFFFDDEETLEEPYGEIWRHLDLSPERLAERERRQETSEELFAELTGKPSPAEAALVSIDLGLLLAESGRAEEIETLAEALRTSLPDEATLIVSAGASAASPSWPWRARPTRGSWRATPPRR